MNTLLQIAELGNFKCLMGDCPDTCCSGWEIPVDSKTFNLWKLDSNTKEFVTKLRIINNSESPHPCSAKILLKDNLSCTFLSENKLCSIHSSLGEEYLSHTCKSYPREINKFWGMFERSMTLSCPEVVNIILNSSQPLSLEYVEEDIEPWIFREISEPNLEFSPELIVKLYEIRTLCLSISQDRNLTIEDRLIRLNNVSKTAVLDPSKLCQLDNNSLENYLSLIKNCLIQRETGAIINFSKSETLLKIIAPYAQNNSYLNNLTEQTSAKISNLENPILLEHILFSLLLRSLFPFPSSKLEECYLEIKNIILLVNALLILQESKTPETTLQEKITLIQKTMRILDHYEDLRNKLRSF